MTSFVNFAHKQNKAIKDNNKKIAFTATTTKGYFDISSHSSDTHLIFPPYILRKKNEILGKDFFLAHCHQPGVHAWRSL